MATRLISAGIGIVLALIVLFLHNTVVFPIAVGIVSAIGLFELYRALRLQRYPVSFCAGLLYALAAPSMAVGSLAKFRMLLTVSCLTVIMFDYIRHKTKMTARSFFGLVLGMLLIPGAMSSAVVLNFSHEKHGVIYVVLALMGAWIADSGAYFAGSFFGRHKLCPEISPKKTVEGFVGGIICNVVVFLLFNIVYAAIMKQQGTPVTYSIFATAMLAMACAILGTVGDLTASVLKRQLEIKDYGTIMPGHGGILDRFDSVLLVLPFFSAYITAVGFFRS